MFRYARLRTLFVAKVKSNLAHCHIGIGFGHDDSRRRAQS